MRKSEADTRLPERRPKRFKSTVSRPEHELLVLCARTALDPDQSARLRQLVREDTVDWGYLARSAAAHGVLPLVCRHVFAEGAGAMPEGLADQLRTASYASAGRNLFLTGELVKLLDRLEAEGIQAIPFKGPMLAATAYGDVALRQFCDLDVLVRERDILRAREVAIDCGYRAKLDLTDVQLAEYLRSPSRYNFTLVADAGEPFVELHWGIAEKYLSLPLVGDFLWDRSRRSPLGGANARDLAPEDLLLILCVHGSRHCFNRLQWICDVAEVVRANADLDWSAVRARSNELHCRRMLALGLTLARDVVDAPLPADVSREIDRDRVAASLAARVADQLFVDADTPRHTHDTTVSEEGILVGAISFHVAARERASDRFRYVLHVARLALTPTALDHARGPVSAALGLVPYVLRPFRLTRLYGLRYSVRHVHQVLRQVVRGA